MNAIFATLMIGAVIAVLGMLIWNCILIVRLTEGGLQIPIQLTREIRRRTFECWGKFSWAVLIVAVAVIIYSHEVPTAKESGAVLFVLLFTSCLLYIKLEAILTEFIRSINWAIYMNQLPHVVGLIISVSSADSDKKTGHYIEINSDPEGTQKFYMPEMVQSFDEMMNFFKSVVIIYYDPKYRDGKFMAPFDID